MKMATIDSLKDVRTIASVSALVAVGISTTYFLSELSKIKTEQEELKKHLAALLTTVDPNSKRQIDQIVQAVKILDSRLIKTQGDLELMSKQAPAVIEAPVHPRPAYQRLTEKKSGAATPRVVIPNSVQGDELEVEDDLEDDIAAMKA